jgi:hypothetical protein
MSSSGAPRRHQTPRRPYGSEGLGFESLRARQSFCLSGRGWPTARQSARPTIPLSVPYPPRAPGTCQSRLPAGDPGAASMDDHSSSAPRDTDHPWRPATLTGYRSVTRGLLATRSPSSGRRASLLIRCGARCGRGRTRGPDLRDRWPVRTLRASQSWAHDERLIDAHPLRLIRGPARAAARVPLPPEEVRGLLLTSRGPERCITAQMPPLRRVHVGPTFQRDDGGPRPAHC